MRDGGYDEGYRFCQGFWGTEPAGFVKRVPFLFANVDKLNALDAGCGEGKNAYYLANNGVQVHAIDISLYAIDNAKNMWPSHPNLNWEVGDFSSLDFPNSYFDIVLSTGSLHCLPSFGEIEKTITNLKACTKAGGINVISSFNDRSQDMSGHGVHFKPCFLSHDFYMQSYSDWEIIDSSDTDLNDIHPHTKVEHKHSISRLLVRKMHR